MTQQPTAPWTPERALEMLRCWRDAERYEAFFAKWGNVSSIELAAITALESAIAEIGRQRARADKAEAEVRRMSAWYDEIADTIPCDDAGRHYGIVEWHRIVVAEVERLKAEMALCVTRADRLEGLMAKAQEDAKAAHQREVDYSESVYAWLSRMTGNLGGSNESLMAFVQRDMQRLRSLVAELQASRQQQPEQCGAWGVCTLPKGHNMERDRGPSAR